MKEVIIGIDLGTTNCVVACLDQYEKPIPLKNQDGNLITPSVIFFGPNGNTVVGEEAKGLQGEGEENIAAFFKRSMGQAGYRKRFEGKTYSPTDLSQILLSKLKQDAELAMGVDKIRRAVVTVPAYFKDRQRRETINAASRAGLDAILLNEPTAAALSYGVKSRKRQTIMVYDLGGGTFDITLMETHQDRMEVLATIGDHQLGGKDFDDLIVRYIAQEFENEFDEEIPFSSNPRVRGELLHLAEGLKKGLSQLSKVKVRYSYNGHSLRTSLSLEKFNALSRNLVDRTFSMAERMLAENNMTWESLDEIMLVGGSTRMKIIREQITKRAKRPLVSGINPDEVVALGAAIYAAQINHSKYYLGEGKYVIQDVVPHSLGILVIEGEGKSRRYVNEIIIPRQSSKSLKSSEDLRLPTQSGKMGNLEIYLLQGEFRDKPNKNEVLGLWKCNDIPHHPSGYAELKVTYSHDQDGVVAVRLEHLESGKTLPLNRSDVPQDTSWMSRPPKVAEVQQLSIVLCIDLSGSMSGQPLSDAKAAAIRFLKNDINLDHTQISIVGVADSNKTYTSLNSNFSTLEHAIRSMAIGDVGFGNGAHPFEHASEVLDQTKGKKYIIVLADGIWAYEAVAISSAKNCHRVGIDIIGTGFGAANEDFLEKISSVQSIMNDNINGIFDTIAQILPRNKQQNQQAFYPKRHA